LRCSSRLSSRFPMSDSTAKVEATLCELSDHLDNERQRQILEKLRNRLEPILAKHRPPRVDRSANEWVAALLDAARRDLTAVQALAINMDEHAATVAMLLQMVLEKLAKAYLARTDWNAFIAHRRSHAVANHFTQFLKHNHKYLPAIGPERNKVLAWAEALTRAHPAIAKNGPHLEYPWEHDNQVCTPSRDLAIVKELRDANVQAAPHLVKFAKHFIDKFDDIFAE
jgi:hypothetical protein